LIVIKVVYELLYLNCQVTSDFDETWVWMI